MAASARRTATSAGVSCALLLWLSPSAVRARSAPLISASPIPSAAASSGSSASSAFAETDLDVFMRAVLAHRDENWKKLQQYVLDETEQIELRGSSQTPIWGERREYT